MKTVVLKTGEKINLEKGMEYEVIDSGYQTKLFLIYDKRKNPELQRAYRLEEIQSWGDELNLNALPQIGKEGT